MGCDPGVPTFPSSTLGRVLWSCGHEEVGRSNGCLGPGRTPIGRGRSEEEAGRRGLRSVAALRRRCCAAVESPAFGSTAIQTFSIHVCNLPQCFVGVAAFVRMEWVFRAMDRVS